MYDSASPWRPDAPGGGSGHPAPLSLDGQIWSGLDTLRNSYRDTLFYLVFLSQRCVTVSGLLLKWIIDVTWRAGLVSMRMSWKGRVGARRGSAEFNTTMPHCAVVSVAFASSPSFSELIFNYTTAFKQYMANVPSNLLITEP